MYATMNRISSSVIMARTLMWRSIVTIIRGGNLWGAMWQRPQLARNRFSPSKRASAASCTSLGRLEVGVRVDAGAREGVVGEFSPFACSCAAAYKTPPSMMADNHAMLFSLNFNLRLRDPVEM